MTDQNAKGLMGISEFQKSLHAMRRNKEIDLS